MNETKERELTEEREEELLEKISLKMDEIKKITEQLQERRIAKIKIKIIFEEEKNENV